MSFARHAPARRFASMIQLQNMKIKYVPDTDTVKIGCTQQTAALTTKLALRSFSMRWFSISGAKAISFRASIYCQECGFWGLA